MLNSYSLKGLSLVELLISLVLSMGLIVTVVTHYLQQKKAALNQQSLSEMIHEGNFALHELSHAIRMAGFIGCAQLTNDFPITIASSLSITPITAQNRIVTQKNKLLIRRASELSVPVISTTRGRKTIIVNNDYRFNEGDIVMISDCTSADIFRVASIHNYPEQQLQMITSSIPLSRVYSKDAELSHYLEDEYSIAKTSRRTHRHQVIYGLYRRDIQGKRIEIAANIVDANFVIEKIKQKTVGVSIELLLQSELAINTIPQEVIFSGKTFWPDDGRLYQVLSYYVGLRSL